MSEGSPRAPGAFSAGSRIAGYLLEEQIGRGGMAVVFRAHDERLDRMVALKILAPALADDEAFRQRFIRESRAAAAVDDPHIIPVFEAGEASGVLFIAMRYVRGGDVGTLVRQLGPLPLPRIAGIVSQVASALDAAHARNLVHRDVKPTNMLLDASGGAGRPDHVYLSDFGLSKTSLQVSGLTATGQFLGTLEYVAPEQIESKPVDGRADQYALACATYELLAGTPPFQRDTAMAMMFAQLSDPPPPLASRRPHLPERLDEVLAKALAKAPPSRYQTCTAFAEAVRSACGLEPYDTGAGTAVAPGAGHQATRVAAPVAGVPATALESAPQPHGPVAVTAAAGSSGPSGARGRPTASSVPPVAVPEGGTVVTPPAAGGSGGSPPRASTVPPLTERLTATGPAAGRPRRRTALLASVVSLVVVAAAVVVIEVLTSGHTPSGHHPKITAGTSACVRPHGLVHPAAFAHRLTLHDTGSGNTIVEGAAFSPDGSQLAVGDHNGVTDVWSTATFAGATSSAPTTSLPDPGGSSVGVQAVAFSCDNKSVAIADTAGHVLFWPIIAAVPSSTFVDPSGKPVMAVAFSPTGKLLAAGDQNGDAYLRNLGTGHSIEIPNPNPGDSRGNAVQAVAFSPNGALLATGDSDGTVYLWNAATGVEVKSFADPNSGRNGIQAVAFSPAGQTLAAGDSNGSTYLWNVNTSSNVALPDANPGTIGVVALAFSPAGKTLATGDSNGSTYLWKISIRQPVRVLPGPPGADVQAVVFSPNGHTLAVGFTDGSTYIWQG